ncbi:hypothetical protein CEE44_01140 [Candidatus Woesearchaeota archaeon B3_Woes]|nr:MAG: hypothetical protein CEE44_01140 [Candidatus Woesearchaeota archaeon B3_Woes]
MRDFKKGRSDRKPRRSSRRDDSDEGGDFKSFRARKSSGRSGRRDSSRRSSRIEMHEVVCDKCGEKCEVPFKPTSSKPVYCSDCFTKEDGRSSRGKSSNGLDEVNKKLDKIMKALKIE